MEQILSVVAMVLLIAGLVGQAFEMKRIRASIRTDDMLSSKKIFGDKRNFKWYALIVASLILWFVGRTY